MDLGYFKELLSFFNVNFDSSSYAEKNHRCFYKEMVSYTDYEFGHDSFYHY